MLLLLSKQGEHLVRENVLLKQLLCSKDEIIDALKEEITLLKDKISLIEEVKFLKQSIENKKQIPSEQDKLSYQDQKNISDNNGQVNVNNASQGQGGVTADLINQTLKNVNKQMLENKQREIMRETLNLVDANRGLCVDEEGFKLVQHKKKKLNNSSKDAGGSRAGKSRFNITVGTGSVDQDVAFKSRPTKMWLYIGRVNMGVKKEVVREYITTRCSISNPEELVVNELETKGKSPAFQVGVDKKYYDQLTRGDFWPQDILVRRYNFWQDRKQGQDRRPREAAGGAFLDGSQLLQTGIGQNSTVENRV